MKIKSILKYLLLLAGLVSFLGIIGGLTGLFFYKNQGRLLIKTKDISLHNLEIEYGKTYTFNEIPPNSQEVLPDAVEYGKVHIKFTSFGRECKAMFFHSNDWYLETITFSNPNNKEILITRRSNILGDKYTDSSTSEQLVCDLYLGGP